MITDKEAKEAINTLKSLCDERYSTDEYGDMECLDCPFYRITARGHEYCRLTRDGEYRPKKW